MNTPDLIGDMPTRSWIDRLLPEALRPYARLARLDRPIGSWLLLFPCWWGLTLARDGMLDLYLAALFGAGALIMRGAGCVINDLWDRDIDPKVARTSARPLASGAVSIRGALIFLGVLLVLGFGIVIQMSLQTVIWAIAAMALVIPYPLMKRVTNWPQAWLGLTFNWGALLGWVAVHGQPALPALALYAAGVFWTLGYDTIYAHQDKDDDAKVGVKSSALVLGNASRLAIALFYGATVGLIIVAAHLAQLPEAFAALMLPATVHLAWQVITLDTDDPANCLTRFKSNRDFAALVLAALVGTAFFP